MTIKFLVLGGGGVLVYFLKGCGSANLNFMGVGIFPRNDYRIHSI